jgi:hypothetical protein
MADPLTSSDIIRERMGFGVSPLASEDTRRSYAAAGLSPLGTQDRERIERGGGISPMAGSAEKGAWQMAGYMAGSREQAPVEYGGIGDRPQGSSRRAIRMQDEWDKKQTELLQQQRLSQQMDLEQKQFEMGVRDQQMQEDDFYYNRGLKEAEQKLQAQTRSEATAIISGLNQLDPQSPDYQKNVAVLFGRNPLGAADENVQKVASEYGAANDLYIRSFEVQSEKQEKDAEEQAQIQADVVTYRITPEQQKRMLERNLPAGVVRYNVNAAQPIIAEAKLSQEGAKEAKTEEKAKLKEFTGLLRDQQKALATYNALLQPELERIDSMTVSDVEKNKAKKNVNLIPELKEAFAEARGAAAVLDLPRLKNLQDESEFSKYKSGDRVLAPDGITVIMVP